MANLQSTTATSLTINSNTVWTTNNTTGQNSGVSADLIGGYDIRYISSWNSFNNGVWQNINSFSLGGSTSNWYPMIIDGARNADGTNGLDIRRLSVHQDGSSYGAFFGTIRYRAGTTNFWEVTENWGSGTYYPFLANVQCSTTDTKVAVWLRGGLSYYYRFHSAESFTDNSATVPKSFSGGTVTSVASSSIPSSSHYYQHNICSQGYNLGQSGYGWGTVWSVNTISTSSDLRLKESFDVSFGLEFVMLLKPKSFTWKAHPHWDEPVVNSIDTRRHHGFVAQEVKEAMDQLGITEDEFGGLDTRNPDFYYVRYQEFVPICTQAIQEQLADLADAEARVARLEAMV